jgi:hypothetical protein
MLVLPCVKIREHNTGFAKVKNKPRGDAAVTAI